MTILFLSLPCLTLLFAVATFKVLDWRMRELEERFDAFLDGFLDGDEED